MFAVPLLAGTTGVSDWALWDAQESQGAEHTDLQGAADLKFP